MQRKIRTPLFLGLAAVGGGFSVWSVVTEGALEENEYVIFLFKHKMARYKNNINSNKIPIVYQYYVPVLIVSIPGGRSKNIAIAASSGLPSALR